MGVSLRHDPLHCEQSEHVVTAVFDHGGASVTQHFLDRVLAAETITAKYSERVARDIERGLRRGHFRRDGELDRWSDGRVSDHDVTAQCLCSLDAAEHREQCRLHVLMTDDRCATLDT